MSTTFDAVRQALDALERQAAAEFLLLTALHGFTACDAHDFEPGPEDWVDYELYLERRDYEEDCNARFL